MPRRACRERDTQHLTRTEYDGTITVLAHSFEGKRLTGPNDVVVKSQQADKCIPAFEAVTQLASTNMVTIRLLPILAIPWAFSPRDGIICSEGAMKANWITAS